jgi:hypothetical protein
VSQRTGGEKIIACWTVKTTVKTKTATSVHFLSEVAFSTDDTVTWSAPIIVAQPNERVCDIGASDSGMAVTWLDASLGLQPPTESLYFRTSSDGSTWTPSLDRPGGKLAQSPAPLDPLYGSTTNAVLSEAFASVVEGQHTLKAIGQYRGTAGVSNVFLRSLDPRSSSAPSLLGDSTVDHFLPGAGECGRIAGVYQATVPGPTTANSPFRYSVWSIENIAGPIGPIFVSGVDLVGRDGVRDDTFKPFRRIGEYTSAECTSSVGWAAWTDLRHGKAEIYGAQLPLPTSP